MLRFIDSHCHLDTPEYRGHEEGLLERARAAGVIRVLTVGCDEASSFDAVRYARNSVSGVEIWASVGIHPHDASTAEQGISGEMEDLVASERVVAVGEMGLDFYYDNSPRDVQREVFARQIEWARRVGKPIIVHIRNAADTGDGGDAFSQAMDIMREHRADECGGVIHCFSGNYGDARRALDLGFMISFAGPITYPKSAALRDAAAKIPLESILCETDSPYLAPQSRRGKRNEPACVVEVYEKLAEVRGAKLERISEAVWENAEGLFGRFAARGKI